MASPLPIVVGITGHRDLRPEDGPELETLVGGVLDDIGRRYPHSSLVLLTPLAEGADRLAAHVAIGRGIPIVVPLPMPIALYERDFETRATRDEFHALLGRASGSTELPLLPCHTEVDVRCPGPARDREYAKLGAFVASCSQILIALWDGVCEEEKPGGTSQVVKFQLEGVPHAYDPLRSLLTPPVPGGPVIHIATPRVSRPVIDFVPLTMRTLVPKGKREESFTRLYDRIDLLNHDAGTLQAHLDATRAASRAYLLNSAPADADDRHACLPPPCGRIVDQFTLADGLALHFAGRTLTTLRRIFVGVAVTGFLFQVHAGFFSLEPPRSGSLVASLAALPWLLIGFLACSAFTALWLHRRAEKAEFQSRYQDYRALAEALRVQFYWRVAGFDASVVDSFLRRQRSDLEWIRSALRTWFLQATMSRPGEVSWSLDAGPRTALLRHWIGDQRAYFVSKARREQRTLHREHLVVATLLKLAACGSGVLALMLIVAVIGGPVSARSVRDFISPTVVQQAFIVTIGVLGIGAALLRAYGDQQARPQHVRQFTRMSELFDAAGREFDRLHTEGRPEGAAGLLRDLGVEALEDSADWLILHRERPLELPHG